MSVAEGSVTFASFGTYGVKHELRFSAAGFPDGREHFLQHC